MIVFVVTRGHDYTFKTLREGTYGFPHPRVEVVRYDDLFAATEVARATYVFADLERLSPWEQALAAQLYRAFKDAGLRCLNDPARVMLRVQLLQTLHSAGVNPFTVWRADERPRPVRFPVFLRFEADHAYPISGLIEGQRELGDALEKLRQDGVPLRGVVAIEFCGAPYVDGLWHKWGTFRIGDELWVDHIAVDDNWLVKYGIWEKLTEGVVGAEYEAVSANAFAPELRPAFELGGIEFGRADHAIVRGRTVVYEINTNPTIGHYVPDPKPVRRKTQEIGRTRFAAALAAIDTAAPDAEKVAIGARPLLDAYRGAPKFDSSMPACP